MQRLLSSIVIMLIFSIAVSCKYYEHDFPYQFDKGKIFELKHSLEEISGLSYGTDELLYAIQDEDGKIYALDLNTGEQKSIIEFKKNGDFEGVEKWREYFYVLRSDGTIFKIKGEGEYEKYDFHQNTKGFDFEGLSLSPDQSKLLIACKKHANKKEDNFIIIYQFSLKENKFLDEPFLKIPKASIHKKFRSSGVSINPLGNIVLIAANSFTIAEVDDKGNLIRKAQLPYLSYPQVEGICFSPNGTLYLATEKGDQNRAQLVKLEHYEK